MKLRPLLVVFALLLIPLAAADTLNLPGSGSWTQDTQNGGFKGDVGVGVVGSAYFTGLVSIGTPGGSWSTDAPSITNGAICLVHLTGQTWVLAYADVTTKNGQTKYSTDNGATWSAPVALGHTFEECDLAVLQSGTIVLATSTGLTHAKFFRSTDNGATFTHQQTISSFVDPESVAVTAMGWGIVEDAESGSLTNLEAWRTTNDGVSWGSQGVVYACNSGNLDDLGGVANAGATAQLFVHNCNRDMYASYYDGSWTTTAVDTTGTQLQPGRSVGFDGETGFFTFAAQLVDNNKGFYYSTSDGLAFATQEVGTLSSGGFNPLGFIVNGTAVYSSATDHYFGSATVSPAPLAPASLRATVTVAAEGNSQAQITLRFPVSSNDPDQNQGGYNYFVIPNGLTSMEVQDTTNAADGSGLREAIYTTSGSGDFSFSVRAQNATSGEYSSASCSVVVDINTLFSSAACGSNPPGEIPGTGGSVIPGVDVNQVADDLGIARSAFGWILGISITAGIAAAGFKTMGAMGAMGGSLAGIAVSTAFGLIPLWFILVVALLLAAALFLRSNR